MKITLTDKKLRENRSTSCRFNGGRTIFKYGTFLAEAGWAALLVCMLWTANSPCGSRIPTALCSQPTALSLFSIDYPLLKTHPNTILQPLHKISRVFSSHQYFRISFICRKHFHIRTVKPTRYNVSQFIYFCKTLYMFQTVFPSIIRGSKLHIQRQVFVRPLLLPAASLTADAVCAVLSP